MAKFLAVYIGTASEAEKAQPLDPATEQQGMAAWGRWAADNSSSIVDPGGPLGRTKAVDSNGMRDATNQLTGYVIVEADSIEAAAALFSKHPHFNVFPGDRVEIVECLGMPTS
ncbi:MAG TPA: hypothetical protein VGV07_03025 [Devosia sp.]|jgi:hypothetical protein|uniref:hypothetical protein n=1 Tax=Devosia sp. TaxID=1871048 RepID=UPI002DDDA142|nr:hypothetical protein [Devosia sp.]HEV2514198.1 hypothetical protein [Devosia sp.]